nr:MAG TPA: hypothetical protein [Bacteriophage sp.]
MKDLLSFNSAAPPPGGFLLPRERLFCCLNNTLSFSVVKY